MSLAPGSPGQTFTVDVFVSVFGEAIHTDPSTYGLEEVHIRGYSDTSSGSAFATGAGVGVTSKAPFPVAPGSGFVQSDVTGPATIADNGNTTSGVGIISSTLDGIIDFGARTTTLDDLVLTHPPAVLAPNFGSAGTGANAGGWTFEVAQFQFTTGQAESTAGMTTNFLAHSGQCRYGGRHHARRRQHVDQCSKGERIDRHAADLHGGRSPRAIDISVVAPRPVWALHATAGDGKAPSCRSIQFITRSCAYEVLTKSRATSWRPGGGCHDLACVRRRINVECPVCKARLSI